MYQPHTCVNRTPTLTCVLKKSRCQKFLNPPSLFSFLCSFLLGHGTYSYCSLGLSVKLSVQEARLFSLNSYPCKSTLSDIQNNTFTAHKNVLEYCLLAYLNSLPSVRIRIPQILAFFMVQYFCCHVSTTSTFLIKFPTARRCKLIHREMMIIKKIKKINKKIIITIITTATGSYPPRVPICTPGWRAEIWIKCLEGQKCQALTGI